MLRSVIPCRRQGAQVSWVPRRGTIWLAHVGIDLCTWEKKEPAAARMACDGLNELGAAERSIVCCATAAYLCDYPTDHLLPETGTARY